MNFTQMHERLRLELLRRIQRGTLSVSLLARQTGFGQGHLSNFLHQRRQLSLEAMDRILAAQHMSAADLLPLPMKSSESVTSGENASVPVVTHAAALFEPYPRPSAMQSVLHLPRSVMQTARARAAHSRRNWQRFVAVRIGEEDAAPMEPLVQAGAVVLIDRHYNSLQSYRPGRPCLYAVRVDARLLLRFVDFLSGKLVLRPLNIAFPAELIDLDPEELPSDPIVGRVALVLNEL